MPAPTTDTMLPFAKTESGRIGPPSLWNHSILCHRRWYGTRWLSTRL